MDLRYIMYLNGKGNYYEIPKIKRESTELVLPELPAGWHTVLDEFGHWKYCYTNENRELKEQGWKIHISTQFDEAQKTLEIVIPLLVELDVMFKFVANKWELFLKNSKYGDRSASGKFFTIYPKDNEQFILLLNILENACKELEKGPYILSDKRWKESNIYFRYGGFAEMYTRKGAVRVLAIKNAMGNLVEDKREPSYYLPDFIEEPLEIKEMDKQQEKLQCDLGKFNEYEVLEALHFSNGGGVYKAKHIPTDTIVVLKEGRPGAGLDGQTKDAFYRIKKEAEVLKSLKNVKGVVQYFDSFLAWEHFFLAEEFIDGLSLNTWIAVNYPFSLQQSSRDYCEKAIKILKSIQSAVLEIHSNGIGMGDLQPMNIMVLPNNTIKLIDFESGADKEKDDGIGLDTPGFVTALSNNREEKDWFALLRIARHIFLPICPIQDLDEGIIEYQDIWIRQNFGDEPNRHIGEIEEKCRARFPHLFIKKSMNDYSFMYKDTECEQLVQKLRRGIIKELRDGKQLLPGDIRQYETDGGMFNILNGGFGIVMSLHRTGKIPTKANEWVKRYKKDIVNMNDNGLFTGKAGIAGVILELGDYDTAKKIYESIEVPYEYEDISLRSGMAGIGIALSVASDVFGEERFLEKALIIAEQIDKFFENELKITTIDPDALAVGLFDGWSGVALFYLLLTEITGNTVWAERSIKFVQKDLDECSYDDCGILQTKDSTRYFPYLAGGTAGIGIVIAAIRKHTLRNVWDLEFEAIRKLAGMRCCYNGGVFRGMFGFLAMYNAMFNLKEEDGENLKSIFRGLNLFLVRDDMNQAIYCTGDYGYKLSGDIFSGTAGNLLVLNDLLKKETWCSWMPIPNVKNYNTFK